jgi:ferredoxin
MTEDPLKTASQCRHYAMCKIDYLETGLCPSGPEKHYVAYYPQGRMDIYAALRRNLIPLTEGLIDIADTCTLCGICNKQCHFVTGLRPLSVMKALKAEVETLKESAGSVQSLPEDEALDELKQIVGSSYASNDPAILITYADDPFPLKDSQMPRCVVLPSTTDEVAAIVKLAQRKDIPIVVRGNGASVYGMVFTDGIVMDTARMKNILIDADNWTVTIGAGVTTFELQREASRQNFRVNAAEPAATVCGNIICTGLFATWGAAYGTFADNFIDVELVDNQGRIIHLSDPAAPNLYAYQHRIMSPPGICTRAIVPLHPVTDDEDSLLIPFPNFEDAIRFARELNLRRIGLSIAVLGPHYIATFLSPTLDLSERIKQNLGEVFGVKYAVLVITDSYGRDAVKKMADSVIDSSLLRKLMLGLPRFLDKDWIDLVRSYEGDRPAYAILCDPDAASLIDAVLQPAPETAAQAVDEDLRDFYTTLYAKPQYTDAVWLSMHRIVSCRMGRDKHIFAFLVYLPADDMAMFNSLNETFGRTAEELGVDHDFGFVTPMDMGKRAVYEYDYYLDQTSDEDKKKAATIMQRIVPWLDELALTRKGFTWIKTFFSQGCVRKEGFFYEGFRKRTAE